VKDPTKLLKDPTEFSNEPPQSFRNDPPTMFDLFYIIMAIQAHCTYLEPSDSSPLYPHSSNNNSFTHLAKLGTSIAHCPLSNIYFSASRSFSLREALDADVKVGLGTDVAGGYSLDIMSAMRTAVAVSRIREGQREKEPCGVNATNGPNAKSLAIDWKESLFLATSGGAKALGIDSGLFAVGRPFDAQQSTF